MMAQFPNIRDKHSYFPPTFPIDDQIVRVGPMSSKLAREKREWLAYVMHHPIYSIETSSAENGQGQVYSCIGEYPDQNGDSKPAWVKVHTDHEGNLLKLTVSDFPAGDWQEEGNFRPLAKPKIDASEIAAKSLTRFRQAAAATTVQQQMLNLGPAWKDGNREHKPVQDIDMNNLSNAQAGTLRQLFINDAIDMDPFDKMHVTDIWENLEAKLGEEVADIYNKNDLFKLKEIVREHLTDSEREKLKEILGKHHHDTDIRALSKGNLKLLISKINENKQPLLDYEKAFLGRLLNTRFFITHATESSLDIDLKDEEGNSIKDEEGNQILALFSRNKLLEKDDLDFDEKHTEETDLSKVASDDHVFFSLESGEMPQKLKSRFGDRMLRFPFENKAVQATATLSLVNPMEGGSHNPTSRLKNLMKFDGVYDIKQIMQRLEYRTHSAEDTIFHGSDMLMGLGLAIIDACRDHLPAELAQEMLEKEDINNIVNGLFKPEIMVPRHFFATAHDDTKITKMEAPPSS